MMDDHQHREFCRRIEGFIGRRLAIADRAKKRVHCETARQFQFPDVIDVHGAAVPMRASLLRCASKDLYGVSNAFLKGSFGKVCLAQRFRDGTRWAVKKVRLVPAVDSDGHPVPSKRVTELPRLLQEIRALKAMRLFEDVAWLDNGKVYLVMNLMGGDMQGLLNRLTHQRKSIVRDVARDTLCGAAEQLRTLHRKNNVHLDIKPANIFLTHGGLVRLGDFGLSNICVQGGVTLDAPVGTCGYVAPEVALQKRAYFTSDSFSLGLTWMALVCTRKSPFVVRVGSNADRVAVYAQMFDCFAHFRDGLYETRPDGAPVINLNRLRPGPDGTAWDRFFYDGKRVDEPFCAFVLDRMLTLDPLERADDREISAALNRLRCCKPTWAEVMERGPLLAGAQALGKLGRQRLAKHYLLDHCANAEKQRVAMQAALERLLNCPPLRFLPTDVSVFSSESE